MRLAPGDALLIAGKGHETGQIDRQADVYPFDDVEQASVAVAALDGRDLMPLWTVAEAAAATGGRGARRLAGHGRVDRHPHACSRAICSSR